LLPKTHFLRRVTKIVVIIGSKEQILHSLWQAAEGFFGNNSPKHEPIWTKLGMRGTTVGYHTRKPREIAPGVRGST